MRTVALLLVLVGASAADACGRCGLFGRRCRFKRVVVQKVVPVQHYADPFQRLNVVINNYPPQAYGAAAASYGYGAQPLLSPLNANDFMSLSASLVTGANALASKGVEGAQAVTTHALQLQAEVEKHKTEQLRLQAILGVQQSHQPPQSAELSVDKHGRLKIKVNGQPVQLHARTTQQRSATSPIRQPAAAGSLLTQHCASCHGSKKPDGSPNPTPAGRLTIEGGAKFKPEHFMAIYDRLVTSDPEKRMPKGKPPLSGEIRGRIIEEVRTLVKE